ncbi:hypothetical protein [Streptomyces flavofungini]|uniref:hypothetical protein n=1 Tax=Streptomyces flavofungini TaxID=68200 RepID=UPI001E54CBAB|nr:hypothetical protein [Streptomyces flavofungini]
MHVIRPRGTTKLAAIALAAVVTAVPATAYAAGGEGGPKNQRDSSSSQGGLQNGKINVETRVQTKVNGSSGPAKAGKLSSVDGDWTPPACWYEPAFSPKEIESRVKAWRKVKFFGIGDFVGDVFDAYYKDGDPYKDYNLDKQGEGMFWAAAVNPNRKDDPEANSCDKLPFWVPETETPKEPQAVTPKILAEYAYDELPLPKTEITMAPEGETKVNLPTWIWLDKARFKKVSVTASLPDTNISATTTAEPVSLKINPGTKDATTYPASGECPIVDGRIGEPWAKGKSKKTPPCGVKYLRSSGDGSYKLNATVTWKITWTSTTEPGGRLPDGEFGADQNVVVKEIQSINR